jgi:hypothetical protein
MKNQTTNNPPAWVTDIYMPEGSDRPSFNRPVSRPANSEAEQTNHYLAEVIARANGAESRE